MGFGPQLMRRALPRERRAWIDPTYGLIAGISILVCLICAFVRDLPPLAYIDVALRHDYVIALGAAGVHIIDIFTMNGYATQSDFGYGLALITVGITLILATRRRLASAAFMVAAVGGAVSITVGIKDMVHTSRVLYDGSWATRGFPSGHTSSATAVYVAGAYLLARTGTGAGRRRSIVWAAGIVLAGTVASALTFHFPSEVLGGFALSVAWLSCLRPGAGAWLEAEQG